MFWTIFLGVVELFIAGTVILYVVMVAIALRTHGLHSRVVHPDWHDPAHTADSLLVWVGVKIASQTLRLLKAALDLLEEASADVGEWILHHR